MQCKASTQNQFSFLKSYLVGRVEFRLTSVVTDLSIQAKARIFRISPPTDSRRHSMTRFKILGAAAILSLISATPVFAQAAIQEPGAFAFYYPNNDVLNGWRPTPTAPQHPLQPLPCTCSPHATMDRNTTHSCVT